MYAVDKENEELIKMLIANGADVDEEDIYGNTALFYAVKKCTNNKVISRKWSKCKKGRCRWKHSIILCEE